MPYNPPSYEELHSATADLETTFNRCAGRYFPPVFAVLCEKGSNMEQAYRGHVFAKKNLFFSLSPDEERLQEIGCITRLIIGLKDASDQNLAHNIMLGALFSRRILFKKIYETSIVGRALATLYVSDWFSRERASAMYQTIAEVLGITIDQKIDELTVFTCCSAYHKYLDDIKSKNALYIPPYTNAPDFLKQLKDIILEVGIGATRISEQIRQLNAIQSITPMLRTTDAEVLEGLSTLSRALHAKLATKENFLRDDIIACIPASLCLRAREFIAYLVADDMVVNKKNYDTFVGTMKSRLAIQSQYILLGVYVLVLNDSHVSPYLSEALNESIGGYSLDDDARKLALLALSAYLALPDMRDAFDFTPWHGYDNLKAKVKEHTQALQKKMDKEIEDQFQLV